LRECGKKFWHGTGHRGIAEADIATPRYREQSQAVMQIVLQGTTLITANRHTLASILASAGMADPPVGTEATRCHS
jgi:hypothetical protein